MGKYSQAKTVSTGQKRPIYTRWWFWLIVMCLCGPLWFIVPIGYVAWLIYEYVYYHSERFLSLKESVKAYTQDCNELNQHIESLKDVHLGDNRLESGVAQYSDSSKWNYKRKELDKVRFASNVHNCSRTVCDGARKEPFKYICKYFNIPAEEESLDQFEEILNNFEAAEDGKRALLAEKEQIVQSISNDIPVLIRKLSGKIESKLGFTPVDLSEAYYPKYVFQYVSSGGNASTRCDVTMDIENLNRFVEYLSGRIRFKKSVAGQRALMTSRLRQKIKERDGYTCRKCGLSIEQEPNLLLEIDHIIPVSRGGLTTEDNLQTLCWRCNRTKGARI